MRSAPKSDPVTCRSRHAGVSLALVALVAGCGPEAGATDPAATLDRPLCAAGATLEGLDVSSYQGTVNWTSVKSAGKQFVIIRMAHGLAADTKFSTNWTQARSVGLIRGAYQWLVPSQDVTQQANMMVQAMSTLQADDLPPVVDVEEVGGTTPTQLAAMVRQWVDLVRAGTGRTPIIYSGSYFWDDYVKSTDFNTQPLWIPNYGVTCPRLPAAWSNWAFHQYTSTGSVSGISGNVDLDRFNGTLAQLQALVAASAGQVPATGTLTGAIYEGTDTTARLAGVTVTAGGSSQTTGTDGLYRFDLPPGSYTVSASKSGYAPGAVTRMVTAGTTIWGSLGLSPNTGTTTGTLAGSVYVFDAANPSDTSHPVSGAAVSAGGQTTTTGATGQFSLTVPAGVYLLQVSKAGYASASLSRAVTAGQTTQAVVGLTATGAADRKPPDVAITSPLARASLDLALVTLTGTASDDAGPVPAVSVSLNGAAASAVTVSNGQFSTDLKLRAGANTLVVTARDAAGNEGTATLEVTFRAGVFGTVIDTGSRQPITGAEVTLLGADGSQLGHSTGASYAFDVSAAPAELVLVASAAGFVTHREPVHVSDELRREVVLELIHGVNGAPAVRFTNVHDGDEVGGDILTVEGEGVGIELAAVRVNDVEATVGPGNGFSAPVPLMPGPNAIEVVAFAINGQKLTAKATIQRLEAAHTGCSSTGTSAGWLMLAALAGVLRRNRSRTSR